MTGDPDNFMDERSLIAEFPRDQVSSTADDAVTILPLRGLHSFSRVVL